MKTSILLAAIIACALSAPAVSAEKEFAPAKPATTMDLEQQISQLQENTNALQRQME